MISQTKPDSRIASSFLDSLQSGQYLSTASPYSQLPKLYAVCSLATWHPCPIKALLGNGIANPRPGQHQQSCLPVLRSFHRPHLLIPLSAGGPSNPAVAFLKNQPRKQRGRASSDRVSGPVVGSSSSQKTCRARDGEALLHSLVFLFLQAILGTGSPALSSGASPGRQPDPKRIVEEPDPQQLCVP